MPSLAPEARNPVLMGHLKKILRFPQEEGQGEKLWVFLGFPSARSGSTGLNSGVDTPRLRGSLLFLQFLLLMAFT